MRPGFAILSAGAFVDAIYHAAPDSRFGALLGPEGMTAHLIIFVGMLAVVTSLVLQGARTPRRKSPTQ